MEQKALTIEDLESSPIKKLEISSESESDSEVIVQFTQKSWTAEENGTREEKENLDNGKQLSLSDLQPINQVVENKETKEENKEDELKIGKRVKTKTGKEGVIKFIGETKAAPGVWVGIELDGPGGKNDGSILGEVYFKTKPNHGIFVKPDAIISSSSSTKTPPIERSTPAPFAKKENPKTAADICPTCGKEAGYRRIEFENKVYHPRCFLCTNCKKVIPGQKVFTKDGLPYCVLCPPKQKVLSREPSKQGIGTETVLQDIKICSKCGEAAATFIQFADKQYHMHCFVCTKCGKRINRKAFSDADQNPYCTLCKPTTLYALESPAPKEKEGKPPVKAKAANGKTAAPKIVCEICKKAVLAKPLTMQGKFYHGACLRCNQCKQSLKGEACIVGGQIYCSDCGPKKLKS